MIRFLIRSISRLVAAALLLVLGLCAVEVGLRAWSLRQKLTMPVQTSLEPLTIPSPASWIDVKPLLDIQQETDGRTIRIRTSEQGLRGPSAQIPKPRGVVRIVMLGGDTVFGSEVDDDHTLCSRLTDVLSRQVAYRFEVINAGCPETGPLISLLRYRNHLATLQPDLVLLVVSPHDLMADENCRGALRLDAARQPAFAPHPRTVDCGMAAVDGLCSEFLTFDRLACSLGELAGLQNQGTAAAANSPRHDTVALAPVIPLQELVSSGFGRLLVSLAPHPGSLSSDRPEGISRSFELETELRNLLAQMHRDSEIPVHNASHQMGRLPDQRQLFVSRTGSLSPQGNDIYARELAQFVLSTLGADLLPSEPMPQQAPGRIVPDPIPGTVPVPQQDRWFDSASPSASHQGRQ